VDYFFGRVGRWIDHCVDKVLDFLGVDDFVFVFFGGLASGAFIAASDAFVDFGARGSSCSSGPRLEALPGTLS
jgi:hypothetical protein